MNFGALDDKRFRVFNVLDRLYDSYCVEFANWCIVRFIQGDVQGFILYLLDPADVCLICCSSDLVAVWDLTHDLYKFTFILVLLFLESNEYSLLRVK